MYDIWNGFNYVVRTSHVMNLLSYFSHTQF
jgi:hypothetical protein